MVRGGGGEELGGRGTEKFLICWENHVDSSFHPTRV